MADQEKGISIDVRAFPIENPRNGTVAFASVNIGGVFAVNGIRVVDGQKGLFVAMPSTKDSKGEYRDTCFPITAEFRTLLHEAILGAYKAAELDKEKSAKEPAKESVSEKLRETAKEKEPAKKVYSVTRKASPER